MSTLTERAYLARTRRDIELVQEDIEALFKGVPPEDVPSRYPEELGVSEMLNEMLERLPADENNVDQSTQ